MISWLVERILLVGTGRPDLAESITGDLVTTRRRSAWLLLAACGIAFRYLLDRSIRFVGRGRPRSTRRPVFMNTLWLDLRYALRGLRKSPGFAAVAIITVALGVGANTAIFSLVHGIMLAPLPYPAQSELVRIWPGESVTMGWALSFQETSSFRAVSAYTGARATVAGLGEPLEVYGGGISANHFDVIGVRPALGRGFRPEDQRPSAAPVVVLSHELWQQAFGGDSSVVGSTIDMAEGGDQRPRVVGIMPEGYSPIDENWRYWTPSIIDPANDYPLSSEGCFCWELAGRLAPGVSLMAASSEIGMVAQRIHEHTPEDLREEALATAVVTPMLDDLVGSADRSLMILLGAVLLVLLIACLNVANLMLARGEGRRRELAIRSAMGAGRLRMLTQSLFESLSLGLVGGALGVATRSSRRTSDTVVLI